MKEVLAKLLDWTTLPSAIVIVAWMLSASGLSAALALPGP